MPKLTIRNFAGPQWDAVLDARARIMLASILAGSCRVEIQFAQAGASDGAFVCSLLMIERNGNRHVLHNRQTDAVACIDGVIARAQRKMARRGRARQRDYCGPLSQGEADFAPLQ